MFSKVVNRKSLVTSQFLLGIAIALVVMSLDLWSKKAMFGLLDNYPNQQIEIFSFFSLVKVWNRGVSFGMFNQLEHSKIIFSFIQLAIAFILLFWLYNNQKMHFTYALGFVIGGALGNAIDRIQNGAVADFLDFYVSNYHWPAFNLADSFVFIGVVILIFEDLFKK